MDKQRLQVKDKLQKVLGTDYEVSIGKTSEDSHKTSFDVKKAGTEEGASVYINIEAFSDEDLTQIADQIKEILRCNENTEDFAIGENSAVLSKDYIMDHVFIALSPKENAKGYIHKDFLDLSAVYQINLERDDGFVFFFGFTEDFSNNLAIPLKEIGISLEELDRAAVRNTKAKGLSFADLMQYPFEFDRKIPEADFIIATNKENYFGAAWIYFPEFLSDVANRLNSDFWIVPSSAHDVIICPNKDFSAEFLQDMLNDTNQHNKNPEFILSDSIYYYEKDSRKLRVALSGERKRSMDVARMMQDMFG